MAARGGVLQRAGHATVGFSSLKTPPSHTAASLSTPERKGTVTDGLWDCLLTTVAVG